MVNCLNRKKELLIVAKKNSGLFGMDFEYLQSHRKTKVTIFRFEEE